MGEAEQPELLPEFRTLGTVSIASGGYRISRTVPAELLRHDISDDELGRLGEMKHDHLWDFMWVVLGVALGLAPSMCDHIYGISQGHPITAKGLGEVVIGFAAASVFAVLYLAVYMRRKPAADMVAAIRERTKHTV
jgi:hypothetical protein